jgi:DNA-binding NarL/FixJ family response regulator
MIRIMLVDDHAAVRAGLETVLAREPDLIPVAATEGNEELWPHVRRTRPDLVLLDFHLPGQNSLLICRRLKAMLPAPRVAFYSAYADASLAVPLRLAGADGLSSKGAPAGELLEVVRRVASGELVLPRLTAELQTAAMQPLSIEDRVIAGLLLAETSTTDVAQVLDVDLDAARSRIDRLLGRLAGDHGVVPLKAA